MEQDPSVFRAVTLEANAVEAGRDDWLSFNIA
jgi:hypothetical protein